MAHVETLLLPGVVNLWLVEVNGAGVDAAEGVGEQIAGSSDSHARAAPSRAGPEGRSTPLRSPSADVAGIESREKRSREQGFTATDMHRYVRVRKQLLKNADRRVKNS